MQTPLFQGLQNPPPLPYPPQAPQRRVWPWVVGGLVVAGGAFAVWYGVRKAKAASAKVFTGGVGEDCPRLRWELEARNSGWQLSIYSVSEGGVEKRISTAPVMSAAEASQQIQSQLEQFVSVSKCDYVLAGDDLGQLAAGQSYSGEYIPEPPAPHN